MSSTLISQLIPPVESRIHVTSHLFILHFTPPVLCYFITAALAQLSDTLPLRLGLLPISIWFCFHISTTLDLSNGQPELSYLNEGLLLVMMTLAMRCMDWTFRREPLRRGKGSHPYKPTGVTLDKPFNDIKQLFFDTFDLGFNLRGLGWCWSNGLYIPPETRPTSVPAFCLYVAASALFNFIRFDMLHAAVQSFGHSTFGTPTGGTIFDPSLPPLLRYLRSTVITGLSGLVICSAIEACYDAFTLMGVLGFGQEPDLWPPISNYPLLSTSLSELWAKRWHQIFRSCFISVGGNPLHLLTNNRLASILGSFLVSALLHDWGMWGLGRGTEFNTVGGFFLLNGVGVILENVYRKVSGKRVGGWTGKIWTFCWILGWGNLLIDTWARKGLIGSRFLPNEVRLGKWGVDRAWDYLA